MSIETAVQRGRRRDVRRPWRGAVLLGAVVLVGVLALGAAGLLVGPAGVVLFLLAWVSVPSSGRLSQRLAINGSIALGVVPVLWWVAWPVVAGVTHGVVVLAVALAGAAVVGRRHGWRRVLPRPVVVDALIPAALAACSFLVLPLLTGARHGSSASAILVQVTGGDNAEHFHMFETTRRLGVAGFGWGQDSPHGGGFPYASYPQHLHTFSVFLSQLVGGTEIGSIGREAGLYLAGSTATLLFAAATAVAAIVSHRRLRRQLGAAVVVVAAVISVVFYGFGSTSLQYGFPPFQLAVLAAITAIALVAGCDRMTVPTFAAVVACVLVVGFTWTLAVPLVIPALAGALLLLPRRRRRAIRERVGVALCLIGLLLAGLIEVAAGLASISGVGAGGALVLDGSVAVAPIPDSVVVVVGSIAVSLLLARRRASGFRWRPRWAGPIAIGGAGILGLLVLLALVVLSGGFANGIAYYPVKFLDALYLVLTPILVLAVVSLLVTLRVRIPRALSTLVTFVATLAVLLYSGPPSDGFGQPLAAGMRLRVDLESASTSTTAATERILAAARAMRSASCAHPVFLAPFPDDEPILNGNQWALSLSGTWSNADIAIDDYLRRAGGDTNEGLSSSTIVRHLLLEHPERCVLAVPQVFAGLPASVRQEFESRLVPIAAR